MWSDYGRRSPTSADWIFELKMDGYRLMVRRQDDKVRIYSRRGADFTPRFSSTKRMRPPSTFLSWPISSRKRSVPSAGGSSGGSGESG